MSNATRKQLGIQPEVIRNSDKHAALLTHDLHVGQSYLKPFTPQNKNSQSSMCVASPMAQSTHMWPVKAELKKKL